MAPARRRARRRTAPPRFARARRPAARSARARPRGPSAPRGHRREWESASTSTMSTTTTTTAADSAPSLGCVSLGLRRSPPLVVLYCIVLYCISHVPVPKLRRRQKTNERDRKGQHPGKREEQEERLSQETTPPHSLPQGKGPRRLLRLQFSTAQLSGWSCLRGGCRGCGVWLQRVQLEPSKKTQIPCLLYLNNPWFLQFFLRLSQLL